jgi:alpha-1,3-rhamnosyl/mannosyltransferase
LSPLTHPEWHPAGRVSFFEKKLQASLKQTQHFIAVSEFTRQEMIRILGIPGSKIFRVHNGIHPHFRKWPVEKFSAELRRLKLPNRYLLHVGTIEPRKNLLMLLKAYGALPRNLREACPLVLVGGWGWNSSDVANYFLSTARHQGVISIGYANDQELTAIYNGARALVFPTLYEGFGFPPLEMKACGGAVLASSAAALVEILGSGAHFIDPGDTEGWTKAMAQIIQDDDWHQDLRLTGSNLASKYSWTQSAHHTLAVYQKLIGEPAHARQAA